MKDIVKMSYKNALRHVQSKVQKALKNPSEKNLKEVAVMAFAVSCGDICNCCTEDDFGYCGLRRANIPAHKKYEQYCLPAFLFLAEKELSSNAKTPNARFWDERI